MLANVYLVIVMLVIQQMSRFLCVQCRMSSKKEVAMCTLESILVCRKAFTIVKLYQEVQFQHNVAVHF